METMKDGTPFNPAPICQSKTCPNKTAARLYEKNETTGEERRIDLCKRHAITTHHYYSRDGVEVIAVWNDLTMEDFDD